LLKLKTIDVSGKEEAMATTQNQTKPGASVLSGGQTARKNGFNWWSRHADAPTYEVVGPVEPFD